LEVTIADFGVEAEVNTLMLNASIFQVLGSAKISLKSIKCTMGLAMTTQKLPDGRLLPAVEPYNISLDFDEDNIDVDLIGDVWTEVVDLFTALLKS